MVMEILYINDKVQFDYYFGNELYIRIGILID